MDAGHEETEAVLKALEKRITEEYRQAELEIQAKLDDYLKRFVVKDRTWQKWVKEGKKTKKEYEQWKIGQIAIGRRWEEMKQTIAEDLENASEIARNVADGYMPEVYAINHNYATYEVESGLGVDTSYTLYNRQSVERLLRENPQILPNPGRETMKRIAEGLAVRYNRQMVQSVMLQEILQGESIPEMATKLAERVGERDRKAAIRNARTMTTATQNAGRIDSYRRAQDMGIDLGKQWVATLDGRTRHEHRILDGQIVGVDEEFEIDGEKIAYPGDPNAPGRLIYNCRCALIAAIKGFERDLSDLSIRRSDKLYGMSYDEWKKAKAESNPITLPEEKAENIRGAYINGYRHGGI